MILTIYSILLNARWLKPIRSSKRYSPHVALPSKIPNGLQKDEGFDNLDDLGVMGEGKGCLGNGKEVVHTSSRQCTGSTWHGTNELVWWARDHQRRGLTLLAASFDVAVINDLTISKKIGEERSQNFEKSSSTLTTSSRTRTHFCSSKHRSSQGIDPQDKG